MLVLFTDFILLIRVLDPLSYTSNRYLNDDDIALEELTIIGKLFNVPFGVAG
jgi:hypothetical protein